MVWIRHFDIEVYRSELETTASQALGLDVSIGGRLRLGFSPRPHFTLEDVRVRNGASDIGTAKKVGLVIDLLPLIRGRIQVRDVALEHVELFIERGADRVFNFERSTASGPIGDPLRLARVSMSDGVLRYADRQSGREYVAQGCRLQLRDLQLAGGTTSTLMKRLSLSGKGTCDRIPKQNFAVTDVTFAVAGKGAIFVATPTMWVFGARGNGRIHADFSGAIPKYRVEYALPLFQIDELFKTMSPKQIAQGRVNFSADISMQGSTVREMRQSAQGRVALNGRDITLFGRDLDSELSRFESSQNFNLVDVGALFFAGPLGLAVTKGFTFASLLQGAGGRSEIRELVSEWKVERGIARAQDVAMATRQNRIALHGELDLVNEQFDDVTLAVIDSNGCSKAQEKIHGDFFNPVFENPSTLATIAGSAVNLYKQGRGLFPGGACEVFYTGSVVASE